jgi:hypothetical protein
MARRTFPLALTALLLLGSGGCELVADFDRDKLVPSGPDASLSDAEPPDGATSDGAVEDDAGPDDDDDAGD